jgi:hypothetical protein
MPQDKPKAGVQGEGDHEADRRYREATERFIAEGKVEPAAEEARRAMEEDPEELEKAEEEGKSRAAEEDPEVERP